MRLKLNESIFHGKKLLRTSEIGLSAFRVGTVEGFPNDPSDKLPRYKYNVTVTIEDTANDFAYYTSIADYEAGKKELAGDDLVDAFECFLSDAISGMMTRSDFVSEYGYTNTNPTYTNRIYNACVTTRHALRGISDDDIYKLVNAISEKNFVILKE